MIITRLLRGVRVLPRCTKLLILFGVCILMLRQQTLLSSSSSSSYSSGGGNGIILDQKDFPLPQGVTVAYAISITYCHPDDFIADAAAVLKHSIHLVSTTTATKATSRYYYQMIAFVHPQAQNCTTSLETLGYEVFVKETPIRPDEIQNEQLRHDVTTTGCCQEREFLKLYALTLIDYPIVVHLDLDCILLQPLDDLFDAMLLEDSKRYYYDHYDIYNNNNNDNDDDKRKRQRHPPIRKYIPDAMWSSTKTIPITSYFTRDYNMVKQYNVVPPNRINIQGGFWIVQPNHNVYNELVQIVKDGHGYTTHGGWGTAPSTTTATATSQQQQQPLLSPSSYYGVAQIQGLISYYYGFVRPGSSVELNKCSYNNMVDQPHAKEECSSSAGGGGGQCQDCRLTPLKQIRSIHFTLCQKPWWCPLWIKEKQCSLFHYQWHKIRRHYEQQQQQQQQGGSSSSKDNNVIDDFQIISSDDSTSTVDTTDMKQVLLHFPQHCTRQGSKGYRPIRF